MTITVSKADRKPISFAQIDSALKKQCRLAKTFEPFNDDPSYFTVSAEKIKQIAAECPSRKYKYIPERRDCDDFSKIFQGWMSQRGWGDLFFAKVNLAMPLNQYHSMILAIDHDKKVWFIEPQKGTVQRTISGEILRLNV